jgi:hypothetical protein
MGRKKALETVVFEGQEGGGRKSKEEQIKAIQRTDEQQEFVVDEEHTVRS